MTRPEHVRCENCCFWDKFKVADGGRCKAHPLGPERGGVDFCGEFRSEWPGSHPSEYVAIGEAGELVQMKQGQDGVWRWWIVREDEPST